MAREGSLISGGLTETTTSRRERRLAGRRARRWRLLAWLGPALFGGLFVVVGLALLRVDGAAAGYRGEEISLAERPVVAEAPEVPEPRETREAGGGEEPVGRVASETAQPRGEEFDSGALRREVEGILEGRRGRFGVVVYEPRSGETVDVGGGERFMAASIAKLPPFLTLYREASRGEVDLNEPISIEPYDVVAYGTGELYMYGVGYSLPLRKCAWYLVNKSDNTAWVMLNRKLSPERIKAELRGIGATSTVYEEGVYESTPQDVLKMLQKISDPAYTDERLSEEMLDAMTKTAFEDRIPAGLPEGTRVAHKIGSLGANFGDAAIVEYEEDGERHRYFVVVMAEETVESEAVEVMREVARASHGAIAER